MSLVSTIQENLNKLKQISSYDVLEMMERYVADAIGF